MTNKTKHEQAEGVWQFQHETPIDGDMGKYANDVFTFIYESNTVTLRLLTLRSGQWKSEDDFYKLSTKWEGNTLYYRPPFGNWAELATFEHEQFINIGSGKKRVFKKIRTDEVIQWNKGILKPNRQLHDYRIQPDGSVKQ